MSSQLTNCQLACVVDRVGTGSGTTLWPWAGIPDGWEGHSATDVPGEEKRGPALAAMVEAVGGRTDEPLGLMQRDT